MTLHHGTWGDRETVFGNSTCLVTVLYLQPNKRCSWHKHEKAFNQFYVVSGVLGVKTENGLTKIMEGCDFVVAPGIMHEFQTYAEKTTIVEVCYVEYDHSDIIREKLGGDREKPDVV